MNGIMPNLLNIGVLVFLVSGGLSYPAKRDGKANVCTGPYVELLVSPIADEGYIRRITFEWEELPVGAVIGIFDKEPSDSSVPIYSYTVDSADGWANSTVEEKHKEVDQLGYKAQCLSLYSAYHLGDQKWKGISCLRTEPTWMSDIRDVIGGKSLRTLFLPGTHDSSAYREWDPENPDGLSLKYSVAQDEPLLAQLIYGARYIDLRPAYYPHKDVIWWANHGIVSFYPMLDILAQVRKFLDNTEEIVILDSHEFPEGFDNDDVHRQFIKLLVNELGNYALPASKYNFNTPLKEIWSSGKRLVLSYNRREVLGESDLLWPGVNQVWGDKNNIEDLLAFLKDSVSNPPGEEWSAMAQLTPSVGDVILNTMKGLRHAAEAVNHNVTAQFRTQDWATKTNIVSTDFIRGSGIVQAAIDWNKGGGPCARKRIIRHSKVIKKL